MSATGISVPGRAPAGPWRRWARRLVPLAFVLVLGTAAFLTVTPRSHSRPVTTSASPAARTFTNTYPPDPLVPERAKVHGILSRIPTALVVRGLIRVGSLSQLAGLLPAGTLSHVGRKTWLLTRPIGVEAPASLVVRHPGRLLLGPKAFLEVSKGGLIALQGLHIAGVDAHSRPVASTAPWRGFLVAAESGRLQLVDDVIRNLGHLGDMSYGISMRQPGPGSEVVGCAISGNYFGIYTSHGVGVRIVGNHISGSAVYGIDPQIESRDVLVQGNVVTGSGVHGIILSARDRGVRVLDNTVEGSRLHGIVVYRGSDGNVLQGNHVTGNFDGIVVTDSSSNLIQGNVVSRSKRFALRLSGMSKRNRIVGNTFEDSLLGAYVYGKATGNVLLDNAFSGDRENLRIRRDAPGNRVRPVPPRSELGR